VIALPTMESLSKAPEEIVEVLLAQVGVSFSRFRMIHPFAEAFMEESIKRHGQLLPILVGKVDNRLELLDGFKRFRAYRKLGITTIKARVLHSSLRALKAAMLEANWKARTITEMEEAMVLQSLYREDGLTQVEIATLLGRHKSFVCRRVGLLERLCDEVLNHIRLGLIRASHARHISQLPRGNQEAALACIVKHRLTCRETEKLVALLMERHRSEHDAILWLPLDILDQRTPPRPPKKQIEQPSPLYTDLWRLEQACTPLKIDFEMLNVSLLAEKERQKIVSLFPILENIVKDMRGFYGAVCS
jgi:ParB/RepB/Spo0J family partition protein